MTTRIVPPAEADRIRSGSRRRSPTSGPDPLPALLSGQMVHFDDLRTHFNAVRIRRDHGLLLRYRADGAGGRFYWLEAETPQDQPRRD